MFGTETASFSKNCFVPKWHNFRSSMFGTETASFSKIALCESGSISVVVCLVPKRLCFRKVLCARVAQVSS
jgi:hypothetical protein